MDFSTIVSRCEHHASRTTRTTSPVVVPKYSDGPRRRRHGIIMLLMDAAATADIVLSGGIYSTGILLAQSAAITTTSSAASNNMMILRAAELASFPVIGMFVSTTLGLRVQIPKSMVGALQHFSAGILLTTVAKELLPEMVNAQGLAENFASGLGFFSGVGLLILLGKLLPEERKEEGLQSSSTVLEEGPNALITDADAQVVATPEVKELKQQKQTVSTPLLDDASLLLLPQPLRLRNRKMSLKGEAFALFKGSDVGDTSTSSSSLREAAEPGAKLRGFSISNIASALPTALLTAVVIDAFLDGLLIGISTAIDASTGSILSASLAVESTFLGITIATALRGSGPNISAAILLAATALGPAGILAGSLSGGALAPVLVTSPVLLAGLLGFGTSTTLFMVAEELLLEAHEEGGNHIWWVDLQLYTGFFASVMVEKLVGM